MQSPIKVLYLWTSTQYSFRCFVNSLSSAQFLLWPLQPNRRLSLPQTELWFSPKLFSISSINQSWNTTISVTITLSSCSRRHLLLSLLEKNGPWATYLGDTPFPTWVNSSSLYLWFSWQVAAGNTNPTNRAPSQLQMPDFVEMWAGAGRGQYAHATRFYLSVIEEYQTKNVWETPHLSCVPFWRVVQGSVGYKMALSTNHIIYNATHHG